MAPTVVDANGERMTLPRPSAALIQALRKGTAVAFVGSGLSFDAGAPKWEKLLEEMLKRAKERFPNDRGAQLKIASAQDHYSSDQLLAAADDLKDILGSEWAALLNEHFHRLKPTRVHKQLARLGFAAFVTTNFDTLIEDALEDPFVLRWDERNLVEDLNNGLYNPAKPIVFKLHGTYDHPKSVVLTMRDYQAAQKTEGVNHALKRLLGWGHNLWLGYGYRDPRVEMIRAYLILEGGSGGDALIAKNDRNAALDEMFKLGGVESSVLKDYKDLPLFLQQLEMEVDAYTQGAKHGTSSARNRRVAKSSRESASSTGAPQVVEVEPDPRRPGGPGKGILLLAGISVLLLVVGALVVLKGSSTDLREGPEVRPNGAPGNPQHDRRSQLEGRAPRDKSCIAPKAAVDPTPPASNVTGERTTSEGSQRQQMRKLETSTRQPSVQKASATPAEQVLLKGNVSARDRGAGRPQDRSATGPAPNPSGAAPSSPSRGGYIPGMLEVPH